MSILFDIIAAKVPAHLHEAIAPFTAAASMASFHYADDTGREWGFARRHERECQRLYDEASPELRAAIEAIKGEYMLTLKVRP